MHICTHAHTHIYIYIYSHFSTQPSHISPRLKSLTNAEPEYMDINSGAVAAIAEDQGLMRYRSWSSSLYPKPWYPIKKPWQNGQVELGWTVKSNYSIQNGDGGWLDLVAGKSTKIGSNKEIQPMQPILIHAGGWYEFESYKADFGSAKSSRAIQRLQLVRSQLNKHLRNYPWDSFSNKYQ